MSISEEYKNKIGRKTKKRRKMEKYYDEEYEDFIDCKRHKEEVCWSFSFFFNFFGGGEEWVLGKIFKIVLKPLENFYFFFWWDAKTAFKCWN